MSKPHADEPSRTKAPARRRGQTIGLAALIVAVICVAYSGSFDGGFVSDDIRSVEQNRLLRSLDLDTVEEIFTSFDGANYMPLKVLSLAVDRAVWGPAPTGYHVTNLALHGGCALLVFSILLRLGLSPVTAGLAALIWAVHPLQVESVAWISERKNVLSGLFFFAAFRVYLQFSERPRVLSYLGLLALYVLALLSKMNTMVLPAVCLAYEMTYRRRYRGRDVVAVLPLIALAVAIGWYNLSGNPIHGYGYHGGSALVTWLNTTVVVFRYLGHVLLPVGLLPKYIVPLRGSIFDPPVLFSVLGLLALAALTVRLVQRKRREAFWILWFVLTLAPMLNVIPFRSMMNDRYMYLALLGPMALAGALLERLPGPNGRRAAAVSAALAIIVLTGLTLAQVEHWSNPVTLWAQEVRQTLPGREPGTPDPSYAEKLRLVEQRVAERPGDTAARNILGALYFQGGRFEEAREQLEAAERMRPHDPYILINLGRVLAKEGQLEQAAVRLARATELWPHNFLAHLFALRVHLMRDDAVAARREFDACARIQPAIADGRGLTRERDALQRLEAAR